MVWYSRVQKAHPDSLHCLPPPRTPRPPPPPPRGRTRTRVMRLCDIIRKPLLCVTVQKNSTLVLSRYVWIFTKSQKHNVSTYLTTYLYCVYCEIIKLTQRCFKTEYCFSTYYFSKLIIRFLMAESYLLIEQI